MRKPLGVRLNNPGNLEWGDPWQGLVPRVDSMYAEIGTNQQKRFAQFKSPIYGIRAIARTLITYQDKRVARDGSKIDTVREVIERWAPASENNVDAYTTAVRKAMFGDPTVAEQPLDVHQYEVMKPLVEAIIRHENGKGPLKTLNSWYSDETIDEGLRMAGIRAETPSIAKVPVTRESIGASVTGGVGAAQIAEVLPDVITAVRASEDHLASGDIIRTILGVVLIGTAVYLALGQLKKYRAGLL